MRISDWSSDVCSSDLSAKIKGCRVVGIAGGAEKCAYLVDELGFDAAIDHRSPRFADELATACPDGVDVYFELVGGAVWQAVLPLLNEFARVPVCGLVATYNGLAAAAQPHFPAETLRTISYRKRSVRGTM